MKESDIRKKELVDEMLRLAKNDIINFFSEKNTYQEVPCPACAGVRRNQAFIKEGFQYALCDDCGTLYVNPRPSFEQLRKYYLNGTSAKFFAEKFFPPVAESRRKNIFRPRAKALAPLIKERQLISIGDIGAGFGIFCEELRYFFSDRTLICIEPESTMAEICRRKGLTVIEKTLEEIDATDQQFDLLTSFELMEHLHSPHTFIEKVKTLLKPGGYFLFTTLSIEGFDLQLLWEKSKSIMPPYHINFLNPRAARTMIERCGLECVEITTPGKLDVDILEGRYKEEGVSPERFWKLFFDRVNEETKVAFQEMLIKNRLSSHMWVLARKPSA
ncbi:MAG: class I SAM-dependent methyltransferase [bacterium]|nr:class I SAM-dependent methyltransferase [bacterium]